MWSVQCKYVVGSWVEVDWKKQAEQAKLNTTVDETY